jgi:hypothetical protein
MQVEVDRARAERAAGQQVPSILNSLVAAVDENGNRSVPELVRQAGMHSQDGFIGAAEASKMNTACALDD